MGTLERGMVPRSIVVVIGILHRLRHELAHGICVMAVAEIFGLFVCSVNAVEGFSTLLAVLLNFHLWWREAKRGLEQGRRFADR